MQRYAISSPFVLFLLLAVVGNGVAATPALPAVELPTPIYFLTPGGDSVKIAPGSYQVEAADSWLKLFPAGQARSAAILLEANQGDHDEALTKPAVRLEADAENPDVFHLAMLQTDGSGLEAVGSASGVYPRGSRFRFVRPRRPLFSGAVEQCAPLQVSKLRPIEAGIIFEGANRIGVAFNMAATVRNTNRKVVYSSTRKGTFFNMFAADQTGQAQGSQPYDLTSYIAPGGVQQFTGDKTIQIRRPDRVSPLLTTLKAYVFNKHCKDSRKQRSQSKFVYDLTPVLQGGATQVCLRPHPRCVGNYSADEGPRPYQRTETPTPSVAYKAIHDNGRETDSFIHALITHTKRRPPHDTETKDAIPQSRHAKPAHSGIVDCACHACPHTGIARCLWV